jgi:cytochrome c553
MKKNNLGFQVAALLALLMGAQGCSWNLGRTNPEPTEMHRHFSRTVDIQTGIVVGDLDRARSAAEWLATYQGLEASGPAGASHLEAVRAEAYLISQATDLDSVAKAAGTMAAACGGCHRATNAGPNFVTGSGYPEGQSQAATMIRHLWAADRLWEGLVGPSEDAWDAGAHALGQGWASFGQVIQASASPERARGYVAAVQDLAGAAANATTQEARGAVFGEILSTCNRCHSAVGVAAER